MGTNTIIETTIWGAPKNKSIELFIPKPIAISETTPETNNAKTIASVYGKYLFFNDATPPTRQSALAIRFKTSLYNAG